MERDKEKNAAGDNGHVDFGTGTNVVLATAEAPLLLSDKDSAKLLGISRATFWRRVSDGVFPAPIKIVGRTLWKRDALIAMVESLAKSQTEGSEDV